MTDRTRRTHSRDHKRTDHAKRATVARKQARRAKHTIQGRTR